MLDKKEFQKQLQKIEDFVRTIESTADPAVQASALGLMQTLMDLHGAGIERMMEIVFETGGTGSEIIDRFGDDDLVSSLLLLYGLHPLDLESRVTQALDKVRPYLRSHAGDVELTGIYDGAVRLRLKGSCNGCASSAITMKLAIEEAIYEVAPDVTALEVEGIVAPPVPGSLVQLQHSSGKTATKSNGDGGWETVSDAKLPDSGAVKLIEVSGRSILFCRLGETFYAYSDRCPGCSQIMQSSRLEAAVLVCPTCGQRFDVMRAGRGVDQPGLHLEPFPLLVEQGQAKIALPSLQR
jgi:Fe-S cluster biogenesis protein NfuA/nitrite reductase/ring-hydroxylating ferredoxin subunit